MHKQNFFMNSSETKQRQAIRSYTNSNVYIYKCMSRKEIVKSQSRKSAIKVRSKTCLVINCPINLIIIIIYVLSGVNLIM